LTWIDESKQAQPHINRGLLGWYGLLKTKR